MLLAAAAAAASGPGRHDTGLEPDLATRDGRGRCGPSVRLFAGLFASDRVAPLAGQRARERDGGTEIDKDGD